MKKVILLCGWKGSGKDTIANYLTKKHNYKRFAFADSLKDEISNDYNIKRELFDCRKSKEKKIFIPKLNDYFSPRELCITIGQERKKFDEYYWVNKVVKDINCSKNVKCVISDCRFPIELNRFKLSNFNCISIWVNRFDKNNSSDITETSLSYTNCDYFINNKNDFSTLYVEIEKILKKF